MVRLKKCLTGETVLEMDVKRPTRAVEELHQVAATRTERRLYIHLVGERSRLQRIYSGRSACSRPGTTMRAEIAG